VSLPKSTVARLLKTLETVGAVERGTDGRYRIGQTLGALTGAVPSVADLATRARPYLAALAGSVGEDAGLSVPDGYGVHCIAQQDADNDIQVRDWTGSIAPMHVASAGLAILAQWPDDALDGFLDRKLERLTPRSVVDPESLRARLKEVKVAGYVWTTEEFAEGINSVGAPVFDAAGRVTAAVHVHGPSYRFPAAGTAEDLAGKVVATAERLGAGLR
jgi:DNA-binding IclR family transcriptional regulator